jgi:hypothetical protein
MLLLPGADAARAAQSKPSFAGTWISVPDPGSRVPETQLVIEQTEYELVIEHPSQAGPYKLIYKLDGSQTTNLIPGRVGRGAAATTTSVAAWEGAKLVIRTTIPRGTPPQVFTIRYRQELSIDPQGRLVIDQSAALDGGGPAETNRITYRKKASIPRGPSS